MLAAPSRMTTPKQTVYQRDGSAVSVLLLIVLLQVQLFMFNIIRSVVEKEFLLVLKIVHKFMFNAVFPVAAVFAFVVKLLSVELLTGNHN